MTKIEQARLSDAVRACHHELVNRGRPYANRELRELLKATYPDQVARAMDWLLDDAIQRYSTRVLKNTRPTDAFQQEMVFPDPIARLRLPDVISIPKDVRDLESEDDDPEIVWIPLHAATFEQIDLHIKLLNTNISRSQKKMAAMRKLRSFLAEHLVGEQRLEPLGVVLASLREAAAVAV